MNSAVSPGAIGERVTRHTKYYIPGGDVVFRVCASVIEYCAVINDDP